MKRQRVISGWHDRSIGAGTEWAGQIDDHLNDAQLILLLVSSDFLGSDYCYDVEMTRAMERHESGEALVTPIILRAADWNAAPFGKLQALPKDAKPVTSWDNQDEAFTDVARGIRAAVEELTRNPLVGPSAGGTMEADQPQEPKLRPIWNVPHRRNLNFTGRRDLLDSLRAELTSGQATALTAISGMGGVGKTQLALEYAYHYASQYEAVFWVPSEEPATLAAVFAGLAQLLDLLERDEPEQAVAIEAVLRWLNTYTDWLLVFDNVPGPDSLKEYLPQGLSGHVLITSRYPSWRGVANPLPVQQFQRDESIDFLIKRTGVTDRDAANDLAEALGDLPLALEQAGAYVEQTGGSFSQYLELFQTRYKELLDLESPPPGYEHTIATTWSISIQQLPETAEWICSTCAPSCPRTTFPGT